MIIIVLLMLSVLSCKDNAPDPNADNWVKLKYKGNTYDFANVTMEDWSLDLDGGPGLRAYGETNLDYDAPGQCCNYYVVLYFKKTKNNTFEPHKINFGIRERRAKGSFYVSVYFADLTTGYNLTNFQMDLNQRPPYINGTFNGKLRSPVIKDASVEIDNGSYRLNLTTVRSY